MDDKNNHTYYKFDPTIETIETTYGNIKAYCMSRYAKVIAIDLEDRLKELFHSIGNKDFSTHMSEDYKKFMSTEQAKKAQSLKLFSTNDDSITSTMEEIVQETLKTRQTQLPIGVTNVNDLVDWVQKVGFKYNFKHPYLPKIDELHMLSLDTDIKALDNLIQYMIEGGYRHISEGLIPGNFKISCQLSYAGVVGQADYFDADIDYTKELFKTLPNDKCYYGRETKDGLGFKYYGLFYGTCELGEVNSDFAWGNDIKSSGKIVDAIIKHHMTTNNLTDTDIERVRTSIYNELLSIITKFNPDEYFELKSSVVKSIFDIAIKVFNSNNKVTKEQLCGSR